MMPSNGGSCKKLGSFFYMVEELVDCKHATGHTDEKIGIFFR